MRPDGVARAHAAPCAPRLGAHPSAHHHRLQREPARADHRRASRRRRLPAGADRDPPGGDARDRRRAAVGLEHAVQPARRRGDPDRALRHFERRPREDRVPHRPVAPLRPAHADDLRHPLQLLAARRRQRRLLRADPQFPPPVVAAALSLRRLARGLHQLRRGPRARAEGAFARHALPAARDLAAHGPPRLPERRAGEPDRELQQPEELRRVAARGADQALPALREHRHPG